MYLIQLLQPLHLVLSLILKVEIHHNLNNPLILFRIDPTVNFISPSAYSLVNPDLASYAADAFVYSQLSDLNYRSVSEPTSSNNHHHPTRMSPYARQSFYPMYTQRDIHSPSRTTADYA
jgi:hypothetical protein